MMPTSPKNKLAMSDSDMASSSTFMLKIDLTELDEPYKLAKWIQILPKYRKYFHQNKDYINDKVDHQSNCQSLSEFLYQTQYCGKHIKYDFSESDFEQLLEITNETNNSYDYKEYKWIWEIIAFAQKTEKHSSDKPNMDQSLKWIHTTWKKFEIMEQNELIQNIQKSDQKSDECTEKIELNISENKPNKSENIHMEFTNVNECERSEDIILQTPSGSSAMVFGGSIDAEEQMMLATSNDKGSQARKPTESTDDGNMYEFGGKMRQKSKTKDGYMQAASNDDIVEIDEDNEKEKLTRDGYKSVSLNESQSVNDPEEGRSDSYNGEKQGGCCCCVVL